MGPIALSPPVMSGGVAFPDEVVLPDEMALRDLRWPMLSEYPDLALEGSDVFLAGTDGQVMSAVDIGGLLALTSCPPEESGLARCGAGKASTADGLLVLTPPR